MLQDDMVHSWNRALPVAPPRDERARDPPTGPPSLARVNLHDLAGRTVTQRSGDWQQCVAVARALVCEPAVLPVNEPLSPLDRTFVGDLVDLTGAFTVVRLSALRFPATVRTSSRSAIGGIGWDFVDMAIVPNGRPRQHVK
jgi:predicted ABC-type transport system involved in lysophospholipase L1 biosynthesis ATPase subunit